MSTRHPSPETLGSLRATLQKLEQTNDPEGESFPDLKRILLARIAELELVEALEATEAPAEATAEVAELADVVPPPPAAEEIHPAEPMIEANLEKLD